MPASKPVPIAATVTAVDAGKPVASQNYLAFVTVIYVKITVISNEPLTSSSACAASGL
jgi:hypothetical protein